MGQVLTFKHDGQSPRRAISAREGGAEIVFFTGVRYERHAEPAAVGGKKPAGAPGRSGPRKRQA